MAAEAKTILYYFGGEGCPYCAQQAEFLEELQADHPELVIKKYEVYNNQQNQNIFKNIARQHRVSRLAVPATFIGEEHWVGFNDRIGREIAEKVKSCLSAGCSNAAEYEPDYTEELNKLSELAHPLQTGKALTELSDHFRDRRLILIGEASRGAAEYKRWRLELTRTLIETQDFDFIIIEATENEVAHINDFLKNSSEEKLKKKDIAAALDSTDTVQWNNRYFLEFLQWLGESNNKIEFLGAKMDDSGQPQKKKE
ncbi:MAG: erythromycin esterase family protein [bacterium]